MSTKEESSLRDRSYRLRAGEVLDVSIEEAVDRATTAAREKVGERGQLTAIGFDVLD